MQEIFSSAWGIGSLIGATVLFAAYYFCCAKKIRVINEQIKSIDAVKESEFWAAFKATLIDEKYSTVDAAEIFNVYGGIFTGLGILGTFIGLTFGLSGVDMTNDDVETLKAGVKHLLSGVSSAFITSLVGIFCALVYSVAHHWLMKNFQANVQKLADALDEKFPRCPVEDWLKNLDDTATNHFSEAQSQTKLLKDSYDESQQQTTALKEIGEQVAEAVYKAFDERLAEYVQTICKAIDKLNTGAAKGANDAMKELVGKQMERFSESLDKFSDGIDEKLKTANEIAQIMDEQLLQTLQEFNKTLSAQAQASAAERDEANQKFLETLESLTITLNEVAEKIRTNGELANRQANEEREKHIEQMKQAGEESTRQNREDRELFLTTLNGLIAELREFTNQQQRFMANLANSNAAQISEAVNAFKEIVNRHNDATRKTFADIKKLLDETELYLDNMNDAAGSKAAESTAQLTKNLSETAAQMNNLSAANQMTRQNLVDLSSKLDTFVKNFNGIANELERSTKIINDSLGHYNYEMSEGLHKALSEFDSRMNKAVGYLQELLEGLTDAVEDLKKIRR